MEENTECANRNEIIKKKSKKITIIKTKSEIQHGIADCHLQDTVRDGWDGGGGDQRKPMRTSRITYSFLSLSISLVIYTMGTTVTCWAGERPQLRNCCYTSLRTGRPKPGTGIKARQA